jgi:AcrR family transcriptional regulator
MTTTDGRRARGAISRETVMRLAVDIATVDGLEGLTIGTLATGAKLSKSGVVSLFGTKEQLQLAAIEAAGQIFIDVVLSPALAKPGGRERLEALLENWIVYSETRVFTGGCFFAAAAAEVAAKPGAVRDAIAVHLAAWDDTIQRVVIRAVEKGELAPPSDVAQLAFELRAVLDGANTDSLIFGSAAPYARARTALGRLLSP